MGAPPRIVWTENGEARSALWRSERGAPAPSRVLLADDRTTADHAFDIATQGGALLWRGDFQNARQLLIALARRADRPSRKSLRKGAGVAAPERSIAETFHRVRLARSQRARTLGALLVPLDERYAVPLRRAPDVRQACLEAWGPAGEASVVSLRELLGVIGAHEWRAKGIDVPETGGRIHPHYGVFTPIRREYVGLVAGAPLPAALAKHPLAFDVGTGTGVLAAVLAKRGVPRVIATDADPRALACARENLARLGFATTAEVVEADLFPPGRAGLVVCNPPWVPARPSSALERGIYDADGAMLRGFLSGLAAHLAPGGEGWLVLSDLAEHLGLRTRAELESAFDAAGLRVLQRLDARPDHPKASDPDDPLRDARAAEITSLWRLAAA